LTQRSSPTVREKIGSISLGCSFVAGSIRVPRPAAGITALRLEASDMVVLRFLARAIVREEFPIYGEGLQTRSFCYVSDTVRGILSLLTNPEAAGETVNIGNSREMTILELARLVKKVVRSSSPLAFYPLPKDDPTRRCPDIKKASTLLGWKPQVMIEEGLRKTLKWLIDTKKSSDRS